MDGEIAWWHPLRERRRRRDIEDLAGPHLLRRVAVWIERVAGVLAVLGLLLTGLAGVPAVKAIDSASGRNDPRITAVTTAPAVEIDSEQGPTLSWQSLVTWTDPHGVVHLGTIPVRAAVPTGTRVAARLAADGTVRGEPMSTLGLWVTAGLICMGIGVGAVAVLFCAGQLVQRLTDRLRRDSWQTAWAQLNLTHLT